MGSSEISPGLATVGSLEQSNSPPIITSLNTVDKSKNSNSLISNIAAGLGPLEQISTPESQEKSSG